MTKTASMTSKANAPYFGALDGFRGFFALCVAVYHTSWFSHVNSTAFFNNGTVIIDLFFVFSGFLMFHLYSRKMNTPMDAAKFIKRRFARLYPIHIFMLAIFLLFACARIAANNMGISVQDPGEILPFQPGSTENIWSLLANLTLTHSIGLTESLTYNIPSWTISVEFFAYFVFTAMFLWCPPKTTRHFALIGAGVAIIYIGLALSKPDMNITYDFGFYRCLAGFFTGVIAARIFGSVSKKISCGPAKRFKTASLIELATLCAFVFFVIYMPGKMQFLVGPFILAFVLVFAFDSGVVSKFMSHKVFRYLAAISYSVYMVHAIFAVSFTIIGRKIAPEIFVQGHWAGDLYLLLYLCVVIGASHLTLTFIERPGQKWIQRMNFEKWATKSVGKTA